MAFVLAGVVSSTLAGAAVKPEAVRERYRSILAALASDGIGPALDRLSVLEEEAVGELPTQNRIVSFWKLKLGIVRELLESQPVDVLIPIIMLHHEAYVYYLERRNGVLAGHSRTMATELADIYADRAKNREASIVAGWVMTSFAAQLQEFRALKGSTAFYYRALKLDPSNRLARMNIAVNFEKVGEYYNAAKHFELLLESWPDNSEAARLRLINCRLRLLDPQLMNDYVVGEHERALEQLLDLARSDERTWIGAVAFQEAVRVLERLERVDESEAIVREGIAAYPDDAQLKIQLISILERSRRRSEANALLDALKSSAPAAVSARQTYDTYPHAGLEPAREELLAAMARTMTLLAEGTAETSEGMGS